MFNDQTPWYKRRWLLSGVVAGALYGIVLRFISQILNLRWTVAGGWVMTIAFLVLVPFTIGVVTISEAEGTRRTPIWMWIFAPWIPQLVACLLAVLFRLEGVICLLYAIPITFIGASFGGVAAGVYARIRHAPSRTTLVCVAVLPMLVAPLEANIGAPLQVRTVSTEIRIHGSAATVWRNIERVPAITPAEFHDTWTQRIGFPRPVEATLSYEGIGGVRHASFEKGLLFIETVNAWEPEKRLAFSIHADTAKIPPTTLDEHVTIGGRYFDVLDGEYRLEPLPNGDILLHLSSHEQLSTDFNGYAGLWTDAVMRSIQTSILKVIQHRCERE